MSLQPGFLWKVNAMNKQWYNMTDSELENELSTSTVNGLTKKEASARIRKKGSNVVFRLPHGSFSGYLKDILTDSSSIILILTAIIASVFDNRATSTVIISLLAINCFAALFTYVKAHRIFESMGEYSLPGAKVVRDGHLYLTKMTALVPGDLIYLKAGDIVPADARIIYSENFYVSENGITDNVSAIRKSPQNISMDNNSPENLFNMVFATSVVLKGSARAIVVETGNDTYVKAIGKKELSFANDDLEIFSTLKNYGNKISTLMLVMVIIIMFLEIVTGLKVRGLYEIFLNGMSLAVATMTEFYTAFGHIVVACALFGAKTDKNKTYESAVVKNIKSIETLRDVDCIIFKKDGVLAKSVKNVSSYYYSGHSYDVKNYDRADSFKELVEAAVITTGRYMRVSLETPGMRDTVISPEDSAIIESARNYDVYNIGLDSKYPMLIHISAGRNSEFDMTAVESENKIYAFIKGKASRLLEKCTGYKINGSIEKIDTNSHISLSSVISEGENSNNGVCAVAYTETDIETLSLGIEEVIKKGLTLLGFVAVNSPLYDSCALSVEKISNSGIKLIINSPDASLEDIALAKTLGICQKKQEVLTEREVSILSNEALSSSAYGYSVLSGLTNASVRRVISALKNGGHKVAYCACGLNEITVMDSADIGISQSYFSEKRKRNSKGGIDAATNSDNDALRFKSDVIIPSADDKKEGGISAIFKSILTSKLIYKNITNMLAYLLTVQIARLFIVLYSVFTHDNILTPVQILFGGLIVDLFAVLSIAFSKPCARTVREYKHSEYEMKTPIRFYLKNALFGVFWAAMTIFVPRIITLIGGNLDPDALISASFVSFTILQYIILANVRRVDSIFKLSSFNLNLFYTGSALSVILIFVFALAYPAIGALINLKALNTSAWVAVAVIVASVMTLCESYKIVISKTNINQ